MHMRAVRSAIVAGFVATVSLWVSGCGDQASNTPSSPPTGTSKPTAAESARFLTQSSFGPTDTSIASVMTVDYQGWIANQLVASPSAVHRTYIDLREQQINGADATKHVTQDQFFESFWRQAASGPDELRQRVALALSQIFVISLQDANVGKYIRGLADYYDTLTAGAFGNYRTLLEKVTLHPQMGLYLTSLANQKENAATGLLPDENYAREVMQLFSIGLYQLNSDGSVQTDAGGNPIPTYTHDDIAGLAKVLTGMSWYATTPNATTFFGGAADPNRDWMPMSFYPQYHSISAKTFLGTTIPAAAVPDIAGDLKIALDTIFNHPNVGPFIATRLIQQLTTSNPSPAYVQRVAAAFNNNGAGVRGDLGATVKAVLLDPEARAAVGASANFGKLREPVLRLANWMRAFGASSQAQTVNGPGGAGFLIYNTDDPGTRLGQTAMRSPTVFNFWRPGYAPPSTGLATAGLVAPEFQIVNEVEVAGYLNFMQGVIGRGVGYVVAPATTPDIVSSYANETTLAPNPPDLVARINTVLMYGQMSNGLQQQINAATSTIAIPSGSGVTAAQVQAALARRVQLAVFLTMASPEYLVQR